MMKNKSGITLIALIITIIVLLILAGVSINAVLGDNGVLTQAQNASEKTKVGSEREAIQFVMSDINIDERVGKEVDEGRKIGEALKNRGPGEWNIVTVGDQAYGTNWYLLNKGENIPGFGKAQNSWLINYKTGELIQLEENNYSNLSSSDTVIESARNNIIFSLDASSIGKAESVSDLESEDVDFIGFEDVNENSGLTENSFKFDGVNDYVKIKYDDSPAKNQDGTPYMEDGKQLTKKEVFAKNGFTFEFYGKLDGGTSYNDLGENIEDFYKGLFGFWNGNESEQAELRFGIFDRYCLYYNPGWYSVYSDLSAHGSPWNQIYDLTKAEKQNGDVKEKILKDGTIYDSQNHYIVVSLDTTKIFKTDENGSHYKQTIYLDGEKLIDAGFNSESWNVFVNEMSGLDYFCVGKCSMNSNGWWHYSKMEAYTLRLYNRALTDDEVEKSYQNSLLLQK